MRAKTDNKNYERDLETGALILVNKTKMNEALEKRRQKKDIHNLRQEVDYLKTLLRDLIKEEN
jgi:polyhydroxyalkanoate synthesis regulator phasin|tara:strand:- start:333 stop:521 length:189 start_codon:yes stop_codon:yes gene_type:complete